MDKQNKVTVRCAFPIRFAKYKLGAAIIVVMALAFGSGVLPTSLAAVVDVAKDIYVRWNPGQPPAAPAKVGNVKRPIFLEPGSVMTAGAECYATSENTIRCDVGHGEIPRAAMHAPFSFDVPQGPPGEWNVPPPVTLIGEIRPGAQCVATGVGNTIRCDAEVCPVERIAHGTVGAAPECAITCEAGYTREGTSCVPVPTVTEPTTPTGYCGDAGTATPSWFMICAGPTRGAVTNPLTGSPVSYCYGKAFTIPADSLSFEEKRAMSCGALPSASVSGMQMGICAPSMSGYATAPSYACQ